MQTSDSIEARAAAETAAQNTQSVTQKKKSKAARIAPWKWPKGFCPNPGGRPKRDRAAEIAREVFESNPEAVYKALGRALLKGNAYAFTQLAERAYGKLVQKQELTGKDGGPLEVQESNDTDLSKRIADLERDLGLAGAIDQAGRVGSTQAGAGTKDDAAKDTPILS